MRSGKPILALGPVDGDVARLIRETGTGETFEYDDVAGVSPSSSVISRAVWTCPGRAQWTSVP